jgi:hypothetical protein
MRLLRVSDDSLIVVSSDSVAGRCNISFLNGTLQPIWNKTLELDSEESIDWPSLYTTKWQLMLLTNKKLPGDQVIYRLRAVNLSNGDLPLPIPIAQKPETSTHGPLVEPPSCYRMGECDTSGRFYHSFWSDNVERFMVYRYSPSTSKRDTLDVQGVLYNKNLIVQSFSEYEVAFDATIEKFLGVKVTNKGDLICAVLNTSAHVVRFTKFDPTDRERRAITVSTGFHLAQGERLTNARFAVAPNGNAFVGFGTCSEKSMRSVLLARFDPESVRSEITEHSLDLNWLDDQLGSEEFRSPELGPLVVSGPSDRVVMIWEEAKFAHAGKRIGATAGNLLLAAFDLRGRYSWQEGVRKKQSAVDEHSLRTIGYSPSVRRADYVRIFFGSGDLERRECDLTSGVEISNREGRRLLKFGDDVAWFPSLFVPLGEKSAVYIGEQTSEKGTKGIISRIDWGGLNEPAIGELTQ